MKVIEPENPCNFKVGLSGFFWCREENGERHEDVDEED